MPPKHSPSITPNTALGGVLHYGVNRVFHRNHPLAAHIEEIYYNGFTIIPNVLDAETLRSLSDAIDRLYTVQMQELGGVALAESIYDANNVRCPLAYDDQFIAIAKHPVMIDLMRAILGDNFVLMMQNAIINRPVEGNYQTRWHRDLNYQHWTSSQPLTLNALFCVDPFLFENGCTHVLPGTHLREEFPSDAFVRKYQVPALAPAGSVIFMDSMLYHRAGQNISNKPRRAVNHVIGLPFLAQQIDIPAFVGDRLATDDFSKNYFGYRWRPAPSAKDWRLAKLPHAK